MNALTTGFECLVGFESQIKNQNLSLPQNEEVKEEFVGIGFRVGKQTLLVKMDEVNEIVDMPKCTKVGGTQSWFLGLANVRGNLLPISDLHGYMFGGRGSRRSTSRVLIYQQHGVFVGLKVDDILGLKHFFIDEKVNPNSSSSEQLEPFIDEVFSRTGQQWPVFNIRKFASSNKFVNVLRKQ